MSEGLVFMSEIENEQTRELNEGNQVKKGHMMVFTRLRRSSGSEDEKERISRTSLLNAVASLK
jgi:hypothetical protein